MNNYEDKQLIFGLDIGTRTVIGSVGYMEDNKWTIVDCICIAHTERAMKDGQIHDIQKVADVVSRVKSTLEEKLKIKLTSVAIAAAGRVLNTQIAEVQRTFDEVKEINKKIIQELEITGIDEAKNKLEAKNESLSRDYFCIAHTVIRYTLDDYPIVNLESHKGRKIGVEVLATFLPKGVVDSLYAVAKKVDLQVSHLTLEPIAAMNAIIPEQLRLLNLALVDIGAGTSDLAITKEGAVVGYGMIPMAGDGITELLVHKYLVDFNMAEQMKQMMQSEEAITYQDIIGITHTTTKEEMVQTIAHAIDVLVDKIGEQILKLNGEQAPNAIFCVGGGSQMSGLVEKLAQKLNMATERVAVRSTEHLTNMTAQCEVPNGPEMITPIGICLTASKSQEEQFTMVKVADESIQLINTKSLTVLDALIQAGITHKELFPSHGKQLMFKVNGQRQRVKGTLGTPAELFLNGKETSLETAIATGDEIAIKPAVWGMDGKATIKSYIDEAELKTIFVNGSSMELPLILVNGDCVGIDYEVKEQDQITISSIQTIQELIKALDGTFTGILVNGEEKDGSYEMQYHDLIELSHENVVKEQEAVEQVLEITSEEKQEENKKEITQTDQAFIIVTVNEKTILLPSKEEAYMFANIFDYIDFDLSKPRGTVQLRLNGQVASVADTINEGDKLHIYWEN